MTDEAGRVASPLTEGLGPLYPQRDIVAQGQHYLRHVDAMTREALHAKSRIAAELAARDIEIERLRAALAERGPRWADGGDAMAGALAGM